MSATTLFYLLIGLLVGIWLIVLISFWYGRRLLERQSALIASVLPYLKQVQQERETLCSLSIPDTTPLSKLQDMTLPDNVQVDFQHRHS